MVTKANRIHHVTDREFSRLAKYANLVDKYGKEIIFREDDIDYRSNTFNF